MHNEARPTKNPDKHSSGSGPRCAHPGHSTGKPPSEIRIGYAVSKTGPYAGGATTTTIPNYQLWVEEVNRAGGIEINGTRVPVRVIEYDDRSSSEEAVRAIERLINQDKVHFVLPPWGTALNLAVGPILHRHGYPHLAVTSVSDRIVDLAQRWPNAFFFGDTSRSYAENVVGALKQLREEGKLEGKVALVHVADQFGIELSRAATTALREAGFNIVYNRSYPAGSQDMQSIVNEARRHDPEVFLAFSYPPDTLALTDQARLLGLNPKVFYTAVATAFPLYKQRFGDNAEGVWGAGGIDPNNAEIKAYMARHLEVTGREPDRWLSPVTYASLQVLQQAIERAGTLDRAAVAKQMREGSFETIVGTITLHDQIYRGGWMVGQWQDGEFHAIAPNRDGAQPVRFPKPQWQ